MKMTSTTATENAQSGDTEQKTTSGSPSKDQQPADDTNVKQQDGDDSKKMIDEESGKDKVTSPSKLKTLLPQKTPVHKMDYEQDKVYLYQFNRCPTVPSISPYCLKVETWLRLAGINYENVDHRMRYRSRKGQLPFVELNGKEIADSDIVIRELSKHFDKNLDEGLTEEQRNISHAFESMLNNHTSWVVRWWRYNNPGEFLDAAQLDVKRALNSKLPKGLLTVLFKIGFRSNVKQAVGHGIGHHSTEEIYDFGKGDLKALSQCLCDKEYFFGKEPHLLDCVAFAHLCQFMYVPFGGMKEWIENETPNLVQFVARMKERLWPDWDDACSTLDLNTHLPKKEGSSEETNKENNLKEEEKKKKEEKKRVKEEQKREKEEKKKKEKEEKERKKQEEKEKAEKEKAEKEAKEKAEKEAKEKAEQEAKDAAAAAAATTETPAPATEAKTEESKPEETSESKKEETGAGDAPATAEGTEKKE